MKLKAHAFIKGSGWTHCELQSGDQYGGLNYWLYIDGLGDWPIAVFDYDEDSITLYVDRLKKSFEVGNMCMVMNEIRSFLNDPLDTITSQITITFDL